MTSSLKDEMRMREAEVDPETLLNQGPPDETEVPEEVVMEEGVPTPDVAIVVIDQGVPGPDSAMVVDMNPSRTEGVELMDIANPTVAIDSGGNGKGPRKERRDRGKAQMAAGVEGGAREPTSQAGKTSGFRPPAGEAEEARVLLYGEIHPDPVQRAEGRGTRREVKPALEADARELAQGPAERMQLRQRGRDASRKRKLAFLLCQEVRRVMEELELRRELLLGVWSKMRLRQPLLNVLRTRYEELKPDDLLLMPIECLEHLDRFYRKLDEFRLYIQVTEDMPTTLEVSYERFRLSLSQIARPLLWHLDAAHHYEEALPASMPGPGEILDD